MAAIFALAVLQPGPVAAQVTAFKQAVAEAASDDADVASFYRQAGYRPLWTDTGAEARARRGALMRALDAANAHGLPSERYEAERLWRALKEVRSQRDLGLLEVELTRTFLRYARDIQTGLVVPSRVDGAIVREIPYRERTSLLSGLRQSGDPRAFFAALAPATDEYVGLMKHKLRLERALSGGGWGPQVPGQKLEPGQTGPGVVALRNRLMAMGYLERTATARYDAALETAVRDFQVAHGLVEDGVAGPGTLTEINVSMERRLQSVIVAMERERWMNRERGDRHVLVNLTDFSAQIVDRGKVTFRTRSVIGKNTSDRRTPEFSDVMEHMVINPSWFVPRSIVTKEYLPKLQRNPYAVQHLVITDSRGRQVNRGAVNFAAYSARTFPFAMRQPPSKSNALGLVKFMFPNKHNIYLHDTPQKHLFSRDVRAFSHGCVRLAEPFEFAYALLAAQTDDPEGTFQRILSSGNETRVDLEAPVPVHLIYRTAFIGPRGEVSYRRDVYGRDARIWEALERAGVALRAVRG